MGTNAIYRMVVDVLKWGKTETAVPSYVSRSWGAATIYATPDEAKLEWGPLTYSLPPVLSRAVWSALDEITA